MDRGKKDNRVAVDEAAAAIDAYRRAGCGVVDVTDDDEDHFWWFHRPQDIEKRASTPGWKIQPPDDGAVVSG